MRSPDDSRRRKLIGAGRSFFFAIGVVTAPTTWILLRAAISPSVFTTPLSVAIPFVILFHGVPILVIFAGGEYTRRRGASAARRFRAVATAAAVGFLLLHLSGATFTSVLHSLPTATIVRLTALATYTALSIGILGLVFRARWWMERSTAGVIETLGVVGLLATMLLVRNLDSSGAAAAYYEVDVAASGHEATSMPPVFVIVFDELSGDALLGPDGTIDAERFPNFASLGANGAFFTNARANYFNTHYALPSLTERLTEVAPVRSYIQFLGADLALADSCGEARLECRGISSLTKQGQLSIFKHLALTAVAELVPDPWRIGTDPALGTVAATMGVPAAIADPDALHLFTEAHIERFLADVESEETHGTIYLLHTLATHYPYIRSDNGGIRPDPVGRGDDGLLVDTNAGLSERRTATRDSAGIEPLAEAYLGQIAYADLLLGRILDSLREHAVLGEAIVIVTADHGVRPELVGGAPPETVDDWITRVPLLVSAPGFDPARIEYNVLQVDLADSIQRLRSSGAEQGTFEEAFAASDEVPWFVVHGRWVYHLIDGDWVLMAEFEAKPTLDRGDATCFAAPESCQDARVSTGGPE